LLRKKGLNRFALELSIGLDWNRRSVSTGITNRFQLESAIDLNRNQQSVWTGIT